MRDEGGNIPSLHPPKTRDVHPLFFFPFSRTIIVEAAHPVNLSPQPFRHKGTSGRAREFSPSFASAAKLVGTSSFSDGVFFSLFFSSWRVQDGRRGLYWFAPDGGYGWSGSILSFLFFFFQGVLASPTFAVHRCSRTSFSKRSENLFSPSFFPLFPFPPPPLKFEGFKQGP